MGGCTAHVTPVGVFNGKGQRNVMHSRRKGGNSDLCGFFFRNRFDGERHNVGDSHGDSVAQVGNSQTSPHFQPHGSRDNGALCHCGQILLHFIKGFSTGEQRQAVRDALGESDRVIGR